MQVPSVASVSPLTTGTPLNERASADRDRKRDDVLREERQREIPAALPSGVGSRLDRRA